MLILSRKKNEKIYIGDDIEIMLIEIRGDKVRLGIDAPDDVEVHREEVYHAIQKQKKAGEVNPFACRWCGMTVHEHRQPNEGHDHGMGLRLCTIEGVTSQFFTPPVSTR